MPPSLDNLLLVMAVAFAAPLVLGLLPRLQLPSVVLEIVAGIVVGPAVLGWVEVDQAVEVVALIGLAFVLFLAGLEIEFEKLRGPLLRLTAAGFALSFAIAIAVSLLLSAGGLVDTPLLVAIILCATSLGVLVPVLKDAGEIGSTFGQLIIAAATIADFGAIILLSLFFSGEGGAGSTALLLGSLFALGVVVLAVVRGAEHSMRIRADLQRLQDTTAQIRVRAALVLFVGFAAVAEALGLEVILGTFAELAGGKDGHVVVISTASSLGEAAIDAYRELFLGLGIGRVSGIRPEERAEADDPGGVAAPVADVRIVNSELMPVIT